MKLNIIGHVARLEKDDFTIYVVGDVYTIEYTTKEGLPLSTFRYAESLADALKNFIVLAAL